MLFIDNKDSVFWWLAKKENRAPGTDKEIITKGY